MLKTKILKIASALAAGSLLFAFASCYDGDSSGSEPADTPKQEEGKKDETSDAADYEYTFDFSTIGSYTSDTKVTYTSDTYYDTVVFLYSKSEGLRIRKDTNYINYNGSNLNDTTATVGSAYPGSTDVDRYCGFDASKAGVTSDITVEFAYKVVNSTNASDDTGLIAIVDGNKKVLAVKTGLKVKSGSDTGTISAKIPATDKAILYFSRGGQNGGGLDVTAITAKKAN